MNFKSLLQAEEQRIGFDLESADLDGVLKVLEGVKKEEQHVWIAQSIADKLTTWWRSGHPDLRAFVDDAKNVQALYKAISAIAVNFAKQDRGCYLVTQNLLACMESNALSDDSKRQASVQGVAARVFLGLVTKAAKSGLAPYMINELAQKGIAADEGKHRQKFAMDEESVAEQQPVPQSLPVASGKLSFQEMAAIFRDPKKLAYYLNEANGPTRAPFVLGEVKAVMVQATVVPGKVEIPLATRRFNRIEQTGFEETLSKS